MADFTYHKMFPLAHSDTPWRKITGDYVSTVTVDGKTLLKVDTRALTLLPAARATAISYVQVGFAALWGWWIFGESINLPTAIGAVLILIATLICLAQAPTVAITEESTQPPLR